MKKPSNNSDTENANKSIVWSCMACCRQISSLITKSLSYYKTFRESHEGCKSHADKYNNQSLVIESKRFQIFVYILYAWVLII